MNRNGGMVAGLLVLATIFGISNLPKNSESPNDAESKKSKLPAGKTAAASNPQPSAPCLNIGDRLRRFVNSTDARPIEAPVESWTLPATCYDNAQVPANATAVQALRQVRFAVATVPNPVSTHLPLFFDRTVEAIQQAAQDNDYSYDASWFPWEDVSQGTNKDYPLLGDQQKAEELQDIQEAQPGVMVFRRSIGPDRDQPNESDYAYDHGLVVFLVGEQPTGGISDEQFENALAWIALLEGASNPQPLRILGPTFSGSLPSLQRDLELAVSFHSLKAQSEIDVSSGTVSSGYSFQSFQTWIRRYGNRSYFRTALENDSLMVDRFCEYLQQQEYPLNKVAVLSEDETAFGVAANEKERTGQEPCGNAIRLYYPRDIATLRSAYERQSIFGSAKSQSTASGPSTTLRGDLSEPASSDHDTVRSYGGQLTPLAQESILLDITNRLNEKRIQFIILRSTNSLDQIFLSEFLRRSYPEGRVVIDGADLLFSRGAEGRSLRGVMVLSTYPLLTSEQDWTASLLTPRRRSYRTFGQDTSEAAYIAARELFRYPDTKLSPDTIPIHDYTVPGWALGSQARLAQSQRPATWISVIGHRQFWPIAVLSKDSRALSILPDSTDRGDKPLFDDAESRPLRLPTATWMFLIVFLFWSALHVYFCWDGCILGSPRARAYFAPVPQWQHPALVALGSLLIAMLAVVFAAGSGLFSWRVAYAFQERWTGIVLPISLLACVALAFLACRRNYQLEPLRARPFQKSDADIKSWHLVAGWAAVLAFALFVLVHLYLVSKLKPWDTIPAYWRGVNLLSGVSPLLPQLLLIVGAYLWFWCSLRGLAHFGDDRPLLPSRNQLPMYPESPEYKEASMMPMFSREDVGTPVENAARPLTKGYVLRLLVVFIISGGVCALALQGPWVRTLGERTFGKLIFWSVCICVAVILADGIEIWRAWNELRQLLIHLDRLPLRRTLRALKGLAWGSIWKMSGNVLEERYRVISLQFESLRHLANATEQWAPNEPSDVAHKAELEQKLILCRGKADSFSRWFVGIPKGQPIDLTYLRDFQDELASTAGLVMKNVLIPEWRKETVSLIFDRSKVIGKGDDDETEPAIPIAEVPLHVTAAEEFFVLPYLAFIQNILGRIRTIGLGSLWLFVGTTLAVSSYPFDPLNVLGGIFLTVFLLFGGLTVLVYSQMSRDATLSHFTNTRPGELGWDFWQRLATFGVGPLIGLLTTLFPSITEFLFSWLQPGTQALK
jgi:hypothetical protein